MSVPTDTFQVFQAIGDREDLIDVITNIAPMDTYVTSSTKSSKATGVYHEWQTDTLAAAAANAQIEGDDATNIAVVPTTRAGNYCQIVRKVWQVSDTQEVVNKAGRGSELDYQKMKSMKELARDIEYALLINSSSVSGASGTARQLKGMLGWITTNVTTGTAGGASTPLTEAILNANLQLIWAQGGFPSVALVGAFQKRTISGFSVNTREVDAESGAVQRAVDIYKSDFGPIQIRLHHQINTTAPSKIIILGDMSLWVKAWLRPMVSEELARTGSSRKFMVEAELTMESRQEKGSGYIDNCATA
jgi:hypothetical protein